MTPKECEEKVINLFAGIALEAKVAPWYMAKICDLLQNALCAAVAEERDAILRTLRVVHKEHCVTHEEAKGVQLAIDCIRARPCPCAACTTREACTRLVESRKGE